jgi:3-oxoacyl-[acyl-carrier-protein] synthase III
MDRPLQHTPGVSAISVFEPPWVLANDWFGDTIPRKFVHHTGIETRAISQADEVAMGMSAVRSLQRETGCDLAQCRALVFVSPSFIPPRVAQQHLGPQAAAEERPGRAARRLARRLGLSKCRTVGLNWFCSGYSRAMELVARRLAPRLRLAADEYLLVVVASRISRITDYSDTQTAGLFGDLATATLLAPLHSRKHPVHFRLLYAQAEKQPTGTVYFDFHMRRDCPVPVEGGSREIARERLVYSLDGMAIADAAPRAMAAAVSKALCETGHQGDEVRYIVPHQAGAGIVRFTGMKLDTSGVRGELINGLTQRVGNVSACSIPYALKQKWNQLSGLIACPTAAVGSPGVAEVSQGCILLRATPLHERQTGVAA